MPTVSDTLTFLLGEWSLTRTITDRRAGAETAFAGRATVVELAPGRARYRERGRVRTAGHEGPAGRELRLTRRPDGALDVAFADGRPFHVLDLRSGVAAADHPCRADAYGLSFTVLDADTLLERWEVTGPEKDYAARTTWRRANAT